MRRLGRFTVLQRVASGSLGDLFFGQDPDESLEEGVALKVVPLPADDLRFGRTLLTEAQAAVERSVEGHLPVLDAGRDGGAAFVVWPYVPGQPLSSVVKRARLEARPVPPWVLCMLGAGLARGLAALHAEPWYPGGPAPRIHAAVAPRAIRIGYDGRPHLTGLGLGRARLLRPPPTSRLPLVAPEVLAGRDVGPSADVYALGATLHALLSGREVFRRPRDDETRRAVRDGSAPPLTVRRSDVPPEIVELIRSMMAPRPSARPTDLSEVEGALYRAGGGASDAAQAWWRDTLAVVFREEREGRRRIRQAARRVDSTSEAPPAAEEWSRDVERVTEPETTDLELSETVPDAGSGLSDWLDEAGRSTPRVGRYRLRRLLAKSAWGATFLARDPNLDRDVVVKLIDPDQALDPRLPADEWVRWFKHEAGLAARLRHPRVARILDAGRDGRVYFSVFERVGGQSLRKLLTEGKEFTAAEVRHIAIQLADGLHAVHEAGVVHADVRADNVLVSPDGDVTLLDFSMSVTEGGATHPLLGANLPVLPPEYLDLGVYDARSDQFALGVVCYELASGVPPFRGRSDSELTQAIRGTAPLPLERLGTSDPELSHVLLRLLEKDPALRFRSLQEMVDELSPAGEADPTDPVPVVGSSVRRESARVWSSLVPRIDRLRSIDGDDRGLMAVRASEAMARSLGLGADATERTMAAVAIHDLAERLRVSPRAVELDGAIPEDVARLLSAAPRDAAPDAAIMRAVVHYFQRVRPRDGSVWVSPRRAILELRDGVESREDARAVEALVAHLRDILSALDVPSATPERTVLLAGLPPGERISRALRTDGVRIEHASDGHDAWERLRQGGYDGAIVVRDLAGRDGPSLIRLCRAHPATELMPIILLGGERDPLVSAIRNEPGIQVLPLYVAADALRARVAEWTMDSR